MSLKFSKLRIPVLMVVFASLTLGLGVATTSVSAYQGPRPPKRKILHAETFALATCSQEGDCTHPDVGSCTIVIWSDGDVECNG